MNTSVTKSIRRRISLAIFDPVIVPKHQRMSVRIEQAINAVYPETVTQLCVVHQIRISSRYVVLKERKQFLADLKLIYGAINQEVAYDALQDFEKKWGSKYGYAIKSWKESWEELTAYFDYPMDIRKTKHTSAETGIRHYQPV